MPNRPLRVFLCHSSADKPAVRELYEKLTARGIDAWLDEKKLLPGQQWKLEIPKAVREADAVIICLSKNSITKEGYVQKEIKFALDIALEKPEGTIYLIPAKLEECKVPDSLSDWHWVNLFETHGLDLLFKSLEARANSLNLKAEIPVKKGTTKSPLNPFPSLKWVKENKLVFSNGMEFMCVPAGDFLMGDNNREDESPQHVVNISYVFWIARYPVTNEQYDFYAKSKGIRHPVSNWYKKKDHPVAHVTWNEAADYCRWLDYLLQKELPPKMVVRLPTEAEWEKSARGIDGREYPWGNKFDNNNCNGALDIFYGITNGLLGLTTSVAKYVSNGESPYGCSDLSGNVWEWTHSKYKSYPYNSRDGREDEHRGSARVLRGGSLKEQKESLRCAVRNFSYTNNGFGYFGFRVVISPSIYRV